MILGFKTEIKGRPTYFVQKILACKIDVHAEVFTPKNHTIRAGKRWKVGMKIHMAVRVRTKDYFQFNGDGIGLDRVVSTQDIEIKYERPDAAYPKIIIDGHSLSIFIPEQEKVIERLALNDGFQNIGAFLDWFSSDFSGQIIHWTDERYDFPISKEFQVFDHVRGKTRTFKVGERVCYLGQHDGVITENGTVMLFEGMELFKVLSEQPHKLKKIHSKK